MLRRNPNTEIYQSEAFEQEATESDLIDLDRIAGIIRRQWKVVLAVTVVGMVLGFTYLWFATPLYKAASQVLIDQGDSGLTTQVTGVLDSSQADAAIMSQVELVGSENVAGMAVDALDLTNNAEFMASGASTKSQLMALIKPLMAPFQKLKHSGGNGPAREQAPVSTPRDQAINIIQGNTAVQRVRGTYLLEIDYTNPDPVLAAKIANALADGYLSDQLNSKYDATRRASDWLQQRINQLSKESVAADEAVQNFRATNNLMTANGQLLTDQQVTELNSSLISAQNATAAAKAKVDQINTILASNDPNALVTAALDSPLINSLRQHYLETAKREADFAALVGDQHTQTIRLKQEMDQYQAQIKEELSRIAEGYQSDYQVAMAHEQSARDALTKATQSTPGSNSLLAKLNELQMQSDSVKGLYQAFLQNYQAATQRTSFPIAGARVVTAAEVPNSPSSPIGWLVIGACTFLGGIIGVGVGGLREFRDRFVRTVDHLRSDVGLEFLGLVPLLTSGEAKKSHRSKLTGPEQDIMAGGSILNYAVEHRRSQFAETLRSAKVAADLSLPDSDSKLLGWISLLPNEGKTTLCYNMAALTASMGAKTLVIDADLRRPTLSKNVAPRCKVGLTEVILRKVALRDAILRDPETGLDVLPISISTSGLSTSDLLSSAAFAAVIEEARREYEYVILDLPPIGAVVDARAVSPLMDAFILVVQWGTTSRQFLQATLNAEPRIADKCIGTILNKADLKKLQLYKTPGSSESYMAEYSAYFQEDA